MTSMTDNETYNGYRNRETWAFNLHWQNDHGLYLATLDAAEGYLSTTYGPDWKNLPDDEMRGAEFGAGEFVVSYWTDFIDSARREFTDGTALDSELAMFRDEVGSWWRIDYAEVGAAVRESLDNES